MNLAPISDPPMFIGYDWPGVTLNFPVGYLQAGEEVRADMRLLPGGDPYPLTVERSGDAVSFTAPASITAQLKAKSYRADLVLVQTSGVELPMNAGLLIPVQDISTRPSA